MRAITRRTLLGTSAAAFAAAASPAFAATPTPRQSLGPFYPDRLPLDTDNDLILVRGHAAVALGQVCHVAGRVSLIDGTPAAGATVEIWQCDGNGRYLHSADRRSVDRDGNLQGYGRFITGPDGSYRFRTIRPVPYPGRAPHIHFKVAHDSTRALVTQMYVAGAPENRWDRLLNSVRNDAARQSLIVDLQPSPAIEAGSVAGRFDIHLAHR